MKLVHGTFKVVGDFVGKGLTKEIVTELQQEHLRILTGWIKGFVKNELRPGLGIILISGIGRLRSKNKIALGTTTLLQDGTQQFLTPRIVLFKFKRLVDDADLL